MPADRFYTQEPLFTDTIIHLSKEEDLHMRRVMRKKTGDLVELFNGQGSLFKARLLEDGSLLVLQLLQTETLPPTITIAQALIAPSKLDWVTEKCAELGAASLWLFPADYSEKKNVSPTFLTRLQNLAISAAKQSGRLFLMDIRFLPPLHEWPPHENLFFGSTAPEEPKKLPSSFIFAIGPERGFSSSELKVFNKAHALSLGPYTLRTETASLVLLARCL